MNSNYLQSITSGEINDVQVTSDLEKHQHLINLPPFDPDAYIEERILSFIWFKNHYFLK